MFKGYVEKTESRYSMWCEYLPVALSPVNQLQINKVSLDAYKSNLRTQRFDIEV